MANGNLRIKKGTGPILILATLRHTNESIPFSVKWPSGIADYPILSSASHYSLCHNEKG